MKRCDVVVIGAGLPGLAAAASLAQAGKRVTLVERRGVLGGALAALESRSFEAPSRWLSPLVVVPEGGTVHQLALRWCPEACGRPLVADSGWPWWQGETSWALLSPRRLAEAARERFEAAGGELLRRCRAVELEAEGSRLVAVRTQRRPLSTQAIRSGEQAESFRVETSRALLALPARALPELIPSRSANQVAPEVGASSSASLSLAVVHVLDALPIPAPRRVGETAWLLPAESGVVFLGPLTRSGLSGRALAAWAWGQIGAGPVPPSLVPLLEPGGWPLRSETGTRRVPAAPEGCVVPDSGNLTPPNLEAAVRGALQGVAELLRDGG